MNPDKLIGHEIDGIRRTDDGFVKAGWWFFQREFEDKEKPYWYAKKRAMDGRKELEQSKVKEKYIGKELPFKLPRKLMTKGEWNRYKKGDLIILKDQHHSVEQKMRALKQARLKSQNRI